jgi:hypothetical protein
MAQKNFDTASTESQYGAVLGKLNTNEPKAEFSSAATQGKKGKKLDRMNMGFSPENYEYLRTMAGIHKMTITAYVNYIIEQDRKNNTDLYIKARDLMNSL